MSKKRKQRQPLTLFRAEGLQSGWHVQWHNLGIFTSRKTAIRAIEQVVGHKLQWASPATAPNMLEAAGVPGFSRILLYGVDVDSDFEAHIHINPVMEDAMRAEESSPLDDFLRSLTG